MKVAEAVCCVLREESVLDRSSPCDLLTDIKFGGVEVLINLLDTVVGEFSHKDANGKAMCVSLSVLFPNRSPFSFSRSLQLLVSSQDSRAY
jgi:hypothetical protein